MPNPITYPRKSMLIRLEKEVWALVAQAALDREMARTAFIEQVLREYFAQPETRPKRRRISDQPRPEIATDED
jgi:hypothetical protein